MAKRKGEISELKSQLQLAGKDLEDANQQVWSAANSPLAFHACLFFLRQIEVLEGQSTEDKGCIEMLKRAIENKVSDYKSIEVEKCESYQTKKLSYCKCHCSC